MLSRAEPVRMPGETSRRAGDAEGVRDEEAHCRRVLHHVLYDAWTIRPSREEVGDAAVHIALRFDPEGRILSREIVKRSGDPAMDASALKAAEAVERVPGLTETFLRRRGYRVIVAFRLGAEE